MRLAAVSDHEPDVRAARSRSAGPRDAISQSTAQTRCGAAFFAANCAKCHGTGGRGTLRAPPLVGPCALQREPHTGYRIRTREFLTAADVVGFASAKMPPPSGAAGAGLPKEDYYAVVAFILTENGIPLPGPLTPENAKAVPLARRE